MPAGSSTPPPAAEEAPPGLQPALVFTRGPLTGKRITVTGELVLGRENVDVLLEDPEVSRRHASVRPYEGGLELSDLDSLNGTFVNGVRLKAATVLADGDVVRLGGIQLVADVPARAAGTVLSQQPPGTFTGRRDEGTQ